MDSHLSESLEIVDSFDFVRSDRKADFKKELGKAMARVTPYRIRLIISADGVASA